MQGLNEVIGSNAVFGSRLVVTSSDVNDNRSELHFQTRNEVT